MICAGLLRREQRNCDANNFASNCATLAHLWDQVNDDAEGAKVTELFLGNFTLGVKLQAAFRGALERRRKRLGGGQ